MRIFQRELLACIEYRNFSYKRGFSVVEVITAISIFSIVSLIVIRLFVTSTSYFKKEISSSREDFYINEACRYIESEISDNVKTVDIVDNTIILERISYLAPERRPVDYIKLEGQDLVIKYSLYGLISTSNNILKNVEEFSVYKEGKLIYLNLKYKGSKRAQRCIGASGVKQ